LSTYDCSTLVRGAVTVGLGENRDREGANATGFGYASALLGATLEVDGQKLVAEGRLIVWAADNQRKPTKRCRVSLLTPGILLLLVFQIGSNLVQGIGGGGGCGNHSWVRPSACHQFCCIS
jgi:hypothetical protein